MAVTVAALVAFTARAWRIKTNGAEKQIAAAAQPTPVAGAPLQGGQRARSRLHNRLTLQPEADRLRRQLGQRFLASGREVSTLIGTVTFGAERQTARIVRRQDDDDERLTIALNGGPPTLTWSGLDGAKSNGSPATGATRALIERLALDSPDQFILAQLRGSAYFTVSRLVRPSEAGGTDSYAGPVWNVVRISEPADRTQNRPQSSWRLYYLNAATGLIDKALSQEQGQTITAEFSGWVNQGGETIPTRIVWKMNNQTMMELAVTNVTHSPRQ
jgi:hypothetical protein